MNLNVTGFTDQLVMTVYNKSGATLAKGQILSITGVVQVVDSANPSKATLVPSVVDPEAGAGQTASSVCGVAIEDIPSGTAMDAETPATYQHDGLGKACIFGICDVEAGGTIVAGEDVFLDMAAGVVNVDGIIGNANTPATGDYFVGVALEAGSDGDLVRCFWRPPSYWP